MQGYGRGARMTIEQDRIEWLSGVRRGETLGSPIAMRIPNRDWANWQDVMDAGRRAGRAPPPPGDPRPRPGHADLVGVLKYDRDDARDILERASARETAARVAAGALARRLLEEFGVEIGSHVVSLGGIRAAAARRAAVAAQRRGRPLPGARPRPGRRVGHASPDRRGQGGRRHPRRRDRGRAKGLVPGLGSHVSWDRKLDGRLAGLLMSIPAVKGVEIGLGFEAARRPGSPVHDPIDARADARRAACAPAIRGAPTTPAGSRAA